jgi:hypothetical protein
VSSYSSDCLDYFYNGSSENISDARSQIAVLNVTLENQSDTWDKHLQDLQGLVADSENKFHTYQAIY